MKLLSEHKGSGMGAGYTSVLQTHVCQSNSKIQPTHFSFFYHCLALLNMHLIFFMSFFNAVFFEMLNAAVKCISLHLVQKNVLRVLRCSAVLFLISH